MRKRLVLLALLLGVAVWQGPVGHASCVSYLVDAYAHETLTVSSTALPFTATVYDSGSGRPQSALVTIATDNIRFWSDGTAPTATIGHLGTAGTPIEVCGFSNLKNWRMIRQTTDATVSVSYFR